MTPDRQTLVQWAQWDKESVCQAVAEHVNVDRSRVDVDARDGQVWDGRGWWADHAVATFCYWASIQGYIYAGAVTQLIDLPQST